MAISGGQQARGFTRSEKKTITIPTGTATHATPIDLGKNYAFVVIAIADCTKVQAATNLSIAVGVENAVDLFSLSVANTPATPWLQALPILGTMIVRVDGLDFMRYLKLTMSKTATGGDVVFSVWGFDGSVD